MNNIGYVYGYFATESFEYEDVNDKTGVKSHFNISEGDCFYIGISTNSIEERDMNHMKPSKYDGKDGQVINRVLQDNKSKHTIKKLGQIDLIIPFSKKLIHAMEMELVEELEPDVNIYGRK